MTSLEFRLFFPHRVLKLKVLLLLNGSLLPDAENDEELKVYTKQIKWQHSTTIRCYRPRDHECVTSKFHHRRSVCLSVTNHIVSMLRETTWSICVPENTLYFVHLFVVFAQENRRNANFYRFTERTYICRAIVRSSRRIQKRYYSVTAADVRKIAKYLNKTKNVYQQILFYGSEMLTSEMC